MGCQAKAKQARDKARDANKPKSGPFVPKPIDPEVIKVIRLAAAAGKSLIEIKDSLERLDIRNQLNRTFSVTQIKRIVQGHDE